MSIHFVADFLLQSDWMAQGKSKQLLPLMVHANIYAWCFLGFGVNFALITLLLHAATDAITSRINSKLWSAKKVHWFFVGIGADQLLHTFQLVLTYELLHRATT